MEEAREDAAAKRTPGAGYLYDQGQERERKTVDLLIAQDMGSLGPSLAPLLRGYLPWVWLGLRIPKRLLLGDLAPPSMPYSEDIDVLGAGLTPRSDVEFQRFVEEEKQQRPDAHPSRHVQLASVRLREDGGLRWPPDLSYIGAAEVKVSYVNEDVQVKATGSHERARTQALNLCRLGFDKVALLRLCVGAPVSFAGVHPWLGAGSVAQVGLEGMESAFKGPPDDEATMDPFTTVLTSVAAVPGRTEMEAGSTSVPIGLPFCDNPLKAECESRRRAMEAKLYEVMTAHPVPTTIPVFVLACSDAACGKLYVSEGHHDADCPRCGRQPR